MTTKTATASLTREEAAYAYLATFQRGDLVDIQGRQVCYPAVIMTPQQEDGPVLSDAYLIASNNGTRFRVTVADLLSGDRIITSRAGTEAGDVRYFNAATWAMQNPEG